MSVPKQIVNAIKRADRALSEAEIAEKVHEHQRWLVPSRLKKLTRYKRLVARPDGKYATREMLGV